MKIGSYVRVPVHYDMWMRGETTATVVRTYASRKYHSRVIAVLKGWRSGKTFRVWLDELELC